MIIILYVFAAFIIEHYYGLWMLDGEGGQAIQPCLNLMECFVFTVNLGLRNGGGVSDSFFLYPQDDQSKVIGLAFFSVLFFLILQVICLNIVFGIIIDSFSEQRDERNTRDEDLNQKCFVCGNSRSDFISSGTSFDPHVSREHYAWNYIYYILYLKEKGYAELTGLESVIWQNYKKGKSNWLPIGDTIYLAKEQEDKTDYDKLENRINNLEESIKKQHSSVMQQLSILPQLLNIIKTKNKD